MNLGRKFWGYKPANKFLFTVVSFLMLSTVLAACGDSPTATPAATTTTVSTTAATTTISATTTAATTVAPTTAPATTATTTVAPTTAPATTNGGLLNGIITTPAASTATTTASTAPNSTTPSATTTNATSANVGGELTGQLIAVDSGGDTEPVKFDVRVADVENFENLTVDNQIKKPSGVFLVVIYDIANVGPNSGNGVDYVTIQDKDGQKFKEVDDSQLLLALNDLDPDKYPYYSTIQPSSIGHAFQLFDVPANDSGFKLVPQLDMDASTRTPSASSFATTTPVPASGDNSKFGQELVGQTISADNTSYGIKTDVQVTSVEAKTELKSSDKTLKPQGTYLIIGLQMADLGQYPSDAPDTTIQVKDAKGRNFDPLIDGNVSDALQTLDPQKYTQDSQDPVAPGFVRTRYVVFDLPNDATTLKLNAASTFNTSRKVNPTEFKSSGGTGSDSGAGQELVGKTLTSKNNLVFTITNFKRYTELTAGGSSIAKTDGTFLVVGYSLKNGSTQPVDVSLLDLLMKDSLGRVYQSTSYISFGSNPDFVKDFPYSQDQIQPGSSGTGYALFEIPKDAKNLTLQPTDSE